MDAGRLIKVSICVITYNHEQFIARALEGMLMQKTNFNYEIIIGDDASTDGTRKICGDFFDKYPSRIKLLPEKKNLGVKLNFKRTLNECNAEYTAICEGDDYWTDDLKLQKQIDFLESNTQYGLCSTRYTIYNSVNGNITDDGMSAYFAGNTTGIEIRHKNMFEIWLTKTLTVVYRTSLFSTIFIDRYRYFRDNHLFYHILKQSKGYCLNYVSSQYNLHELGIWSSTSLFKKLMIGEKVLYELKRNNQEDTMLADKHASQLLLLINSQIETSSKSFRLFRDILKYAFIKRAPGFIVIKMKQLIRSGKH